MKKTLLCTILVMLFALVGCEEFESDSTSKSNFQKALMENKGTAQNEELDCVEFITLVSTSDVAKELGWTESKVVRDYQVNLWEKPSSKGKGRTVGKMRAGSHARLFDRSGSDYYVQSPLDKSKGWVSDVQVSGTVMKNPKTFEYCD